MSKIVCPYCGETNNLVAAVDNCKESVYPSLDAKGETMWKTDAGIGRTPDSMHIQCNECGGLFPNPD